VRILSKTQLEKAEIPLVVVPGSDAIQPSTDKIAASKKVRKDE
jgi:hypothetical protein